MLIDKDLRLNISCCFWLFYTSKYINRIARSYYYLLFLQRIHIVDCFFPENIAYFASQIFIVNKMVADFRDNFPFNEKIRADRFSKIFYSTKGPIKSFFTNLGENLRFVV